jgi:hypothetical protein
VVRRASRSKDFAVYIDDGPDADEEDEDDDEDEKKVPFERPTHHPPPKLTIRRKTSSSTGVRREGAARSLIRIFRSQKNSLAEILPRLPERRDSTVIEREFDERSSRVLVK